MCNCECTRTADVESIVDDLYSVLAAKDREIAALKKQLDIEKGRGDYLAAEKHGWPLPIEQGETR